MKGWTAELVLQLAPDPASAKAGQGLSSPRHWVSSGKDSNALWGECQGSGAKPYQVRVDLDEPAFKCSCPSRKFPCKHSLGLMLMHAAGAVNDAPRPPFVEEWIASRAERAEKKKEKAEAPPKPVDLEAQQKRKENRLERVAEGLAALKLWLADLVRVGLATVPSRGYGFFDEQARRLIDAQSPGAARLVQELAGIASAGAGWERAFFERLASLYLLIRGFEQRQTLSDSTRELLLSVIGIPRPQEEILVTTPVADRWQIIAQSVSLEDKLRVQHTYLLGARSGERALILAFAHGTQPLDATLIPGHAFDGEICRYPGDPVRALVKRKEELAPMAQIQQRIDIDTLCDQYASERAANPWMEGIVTALAAVRPARGDEKCLLIDAAGRVLRLETSEDAAWTLLAIAGGNPIDVVVHYDGARARPLAALAQGEYVRLMRRSDGIAA
jgi:hypothetical protein